MNRALVPGALQRSTLVRSSAGAGLAFGAAGFFVPQLDGPNYEYALIAGLLLPTAAAITSALTTLKQCSQGRYAQPLPTYRRGLRVGLTLALVVYAVSLMHGLRVGICSLFDGTMMFALGAAPGALLGGVWGGAVGLFAGRRKRKRLAAIALAVAGPLSTALLQIAIFYTTPIVFAYDPFVGYFSGSVYDTLIDWDALIPYRLATLLSLYATYAAAAHLECLPSGGWRKRSWRPALALTGIAAALVSLLTVVGGHRLGQWHSEATIRDELGGAITIGHCELVYDDGIDAQHARRTAQDCSGHITQLSAWLEIDAPPTVTAYLFSGPDQKRRLMGAARTMIAKPWRNEIYLNDAEYPHPTLAHELIHALASVHGRGPFAIAGTVGGVVPNPGLVEGLAEAGAPRDGELTTEQWAAAMRRIEVLPPLQQLFALSFFSTNASTSYTAAGAFVGYVRDAYGMSTVVRWYGGASLEQLTGRGWATLEHDWHAHLEAIPLAPVALAQARARFDRPSVFGRRCPHDVDAMVAGAGSNLSSGHVDSALRGYEQALRLDRGNATALLGQARCHERLGDNRRAEQLLGELSQSETVTVYTREHALEELGDIALRGADVAAARAAYGRAIATSSSEDRLRTLAIKSYYADNPEARLALLALLVGTTPQGPDNKEALDRIGAWRASERDGTADYLFARQHLNNRNYALAAERLDRALERGFPLPRLTKESLRLRIVAACALGDAAVAHDRLRHYLERDDVAEPRRMLALRLVDRCAGR